MSRNVCHVHTKCYCLHFFIIILKTDTKTQTIVRFNQMHQILCIAKRPDLPHHVSFNCRKLCCVSRCRSFFHTNVTRFARFASFLCKDRFLHGLLLWNETICNIWARHLTFFKVPIKTFLFVTHKQAISSFCISYYCGFKCLVTNISLLYPKKCQKPINLLFSLMDCNYLY